MTLEGTLDAAADDDRVTLTFTVRNTSSEPVELRFTDGLRADFTVEDEGREVWRFSDGRMFTQVLSAEEIDPDGRTSYDCTWDDPQSGQFTAVAELRAQDRTCEARTDFSV